MRPTYRTNYGLPEKVSAESIAEAVVSEMESEERFGFIPLILGAVALADKETREKAKEGAYSLLFPKKKKEAEAAAKKAAAAKKKSKHSIPANKDPSKGRSAPSGPSHPGTSLTRPGSADSSSSDDSALAGPLATTEVPEEDYDEDTSDLDVMEQELETTESSEDLESESELEDVESEADLESLSSEVDASFGWMDEDVKEAVGEVYGATCGCSSRWTTR